MQVLKDVGKLLTLTLSQAQNRQPLSGSTTFSRIDIPASSDPFKGTCSSIMFFLTLFSSYSAVPLLNPFVVALLIPKL